MPSLPDDVYDAIDARITAMGLGSYFNGGGVIVGDVPPGVAYPYLLMDPTGETPLVLTNLGQYYSITVQITVVDRTFKKARVGLRTLVIPALTCAPLQIASGHVLHVLPGSVRFRQDGTAWRVLEEFRLARGEPLNRTPA